MSVLLQQTKDELEKAAPAILPRDESGKGLESFREFFGFATNIRTDVGDHDMDKYERLVQQEDTALQALFA